MSNAVNGAEGILYFEGKTVPAAGCHCGCPAIGFCFLDMLKGRPLQQGALEPTVHRGPPLCVRIRPGVVAHQKRRR